VRAGIKGDANDMTSLKRAMKLLLLLAAVVTLSNCGGNDVGGNPEADGGPNGDPDNGTNGDSHNGAGDNSDAGPLGDSSGGGDTLPTVTHITVVMAGDIAESGRTQHAKNNAATMTSHTPTVSAVILAGDNARYGGTGGLLQYYNTYYKPLDQANWGQFDTIAFPGLGNHEYNETNAQGYFDYFATRMTAIAGSGSYHGYVNVVGKGYYSFDLNGWHFVSLNSNCADVTGTVDGCAQGSDQELWLASDLAAHASMPIIAVWHAPRYACGGSHGDDTEMQDMWADLYDAGADFLFVGHNHYYQRWQPLNKGNPEATLDTQNGLAEIVAGSYGVSTYTVCTSVDSRVAKQAGGAGGVGAFFLTIGSDGSYSFEYVLESDGSVFDSGSGWSHHAP
jgi:acid phosphatase type 7